MDLRTTFERHAEIAAKSDFSIGHLYLRGKVVQAWWKNDVLGRPFKKNTRETWTCRNKEDALQVFTDLKERLNS